jgi:hypothetical protein
MKKSNPVYLVFSGYNPRAVISLCRAFSLAGVRFVIIAESKNDPIHVSPYNKNVLKTRSDSKLGPDLFADIGKMLTDATEIIVCPSSEFLNQNLLLIGDQLPRNFVLPLVCRDLYHLITNKRSGVDFFSDNTNVFAPMSITSPSADSDIPFVAKPKKNIIDGQTRYPIFITGKKSYEENYPEISSENFFCQRFIDGKSVYFCYYLPFSTDVCHTFVQENLCQEPGGGSVIWARPAADNNGKIAGLIAEKLLGVGYRGWIMVELMLESDKYYFIEANPRLWGPLQLCIDAAPQLINAFFADFTTDYRYGIFLGGRYACLQK